MEQRNIQAALRTCGFEAREDCDFVVETEFGDWRSFPSVDSDVFVTLGACLVVTRCKVTAIQMLNLSVLKFWVEDKYRMKERITSKIFEQEREEYFRYIRRS